MDKFEEAIGVGTLGNYPASGTGDNRGAGL